MELERDVLVSPTGEVPVIEGELVATIRELAGRGVGSKTIARTVGVARNTVRRYLRQPIAAGVQVRPAARRLTDDGSREARVLYEGRGRRQCRRRAAPAGGARRRRSAFAPSSARSRTFVAAHARRGARDGSRRNARPAISCRSTLARSGSGSLANGCRVFLLVAVLSYSRRLFVKAFLNERQDDWREGIAAAFTHFGGVPRTLLGDNARALVVGRDRATGTVMFHPAYLAFCRDWDVQPRACAPYRARTKGKTEAGVKYVKRNGLADLEFESFAALETHLAGWMALADERIHGTTHEAPIVRFDRDERAMPYARCRSARCRAASSGCADASRTMRSSTSTRSATACRIDWCAITSRSSSMSRRVRIFHGTTLVATHVRSRRAARPRHRSRPL